MTTNFKQRAIEILLSALVTAMMVIAAGYGYNVTVLEPMLAESQAEARGAGVTRFTSDVAMQNVTVSQNATVSGNLVAASLYATNNTITNVQSSYITATNVISMAGGTFTGPLHYGSASSVVSGTTIAHGFGTTPTSFIVQGATLQAATYTQTLYAHSCNVTSCTIGLTQGAITTTNVTWIGGK